MVGLGGASGGRAAGWQGQAGGPGVHSLANMLQALAHTAQANIPFSFPPPGTPFLPSLGAVPQDPQAGRDAAQGCGGGGGGAGGGQLPAAG